MPGASGPGDGRAASRRCDSRSAPLLASADSPSGGCSTGVGVGSGLFGGATIGGTPVVRLGGSVGGGCVVVDGSLVVVDGSLVEGLDVDGSLVDGPDVVGPDVDGWDVEGSTDVVVDSGGVVDGGTVTGDDVDDGNDVDGGVGGDGNGAAVVDWSALAAEAEWAARAAAERTPHVPTIDRNTT